MGARDGAAGCAGIALGVGMQRHQRGEEVAAVAPPRRGDGSAQALASSHASFRGNDTDAAQGGDASSASGGNAGGQVGLNTNTRTHTHTHRQGFLGWLLDRVAEGWARVRSAFGDG